jgi:glutamine synthetase
MVKLQEYIWLDAEGGVRSKTRVVGDDDEPAVWNYDGSSTGQAPAVASEVGLRPVGVWPDPLRSATALGCRCELVLCDMVDTSGNPLTSNYRPVAVAADMSAGDAVAPWFGLEQEYYMLDAMRGLPLGFTGEQQGMFYCGTNRGRALAEEHLAACLSAGLMVSGINAEVGPAQWEYQIGPVEGGAAAADQLIVSRFLLVRLAEKYGVRISFHPKPLPGYNGSGCHANFSTAATRVVDGTRSGIAEMQRILRRMEMGHAALMASDAYGIDNHLRLTGTHETSEMDRFTWGVGSRSSSVRIGRESWLAGGGYFEDRRPAANMNPYRVVAALCQYSS